MLEMFVLLVGIVVYLLIGYLFCRYMMSDSEKFDLSALIFVLAWPLAVGCLLLFGLLVLFWYLFNKEYDDVMALEDDEDYHFLNSDEYLEELDKESEEDEYE